MLFWGASADRAAHRKRRDLADGSKASEFTVVGHKRICRFTPVDVQTLTIKITASRTEPTLRLLKVYQ